MDDNEKELAEFKEAQLKKYLTQYTSMAIAYSGGVDSTYLSAIGNEVLPGKCVLIIADTPSMPRTELNEAIHIAQQYSWLVQVIHTDEFSDPKYLANDENRCYYCKTELLHKIRNLASQQQIEAIACGETADDIHDTTRVGIKAIRELGILTPLMDVGLTKNEIRWLSERRNLPTAHKPSFACLSTRIPKGQTITIHDIQIIEQAEDFLKSLGFRQYRVRHHGLLARIEVEKEDIPKLISEPTRTQVVEKLQALGYRFITVDLMGYRTGSTA